jgi:hypothetical protein
LPAKIQDRKHGKNNYRWFGLFERGGFARTGE